MSIVVVDWEIRLLLVVAFRMRLTLTRMQTVVAAAAAVCQRWERKMPQWCKTPKPTRQQ